MIKQVRRLFQSTCPVRGRTLAHLDASGYEIPISIHLPRAGQDRAASFFMSGSSYFNPPAPCGAGHMEHVGLYIGGGISIHLPRAGQDGNPSMDYADGR